MTRGSFHSRARPSEDAPKRSPEVQIVFTQRTFLPRGKDPPALPAQFVGATTRTEFPEVRADVVHKEPRSLHRREVPATRELRPVLDLARRIEQPPRDPIRREQRPPLRRVPWRHPLSG